MPNAPQIWYEIPMKKEYDLAYSSCPNDTFIFKGIAKGLIPCREMDFHITLEDVETLNQHAAAGRYHVTKLSFAALGSLLDKYALLRTGSALGEGCGPLLISRPGQKLNDSQSPVIAVPGMGTTACHLFQFYMADKFPGLTPEIRPMPFETVMPAVIQKEADFGVIIHEGRFVFQAMGLEMKADLGQWWEDTTGLPIPLGCIAVRRDLALDEACRIQDLIGRSIDHAFAHPEMAADYIRAHAQELEETVIRQHIALYVNAYSKDIGDRGTLAVTTFFDHATRAGLMALPDLPLFAC